MTQKTLKLLNLNIHNYHDFEHRSPKIVALIKKYDPDVVTLQEVRDDENNNEKGNDQSKQLNAALRFQHQTFLRVNDINEAKQLKNHPPNHEGLSVLSKFPFSSREISLEKQDSDRYHRKILVIDLQIDQQKVPLWVVHFSNRDDLARLHAQETLAKAEPVQPIIAGDFNIRSPESNQLAEKYHYISSSKYDYISFPQDGCSYDYIFLPRNRSFLDFECISDEVSDHRALFARIRL